MDHASWQKDINRYFAEEIVLHQPKEDNEFTAKELRDYLQEINVVLSDKSAGSWMRIAEKKGDVVSRMAMHDGRRMRLYRFEIRTDTPES